MSDRQSELDHVVFKEFDLFLQCRGLDRIQPFMQPLFDAAQPTIECA